jgi:diguanylate cyclase (GGDEF)-like protein
VERVDVISRTICRLTCIATLFLLSTCIATAQRNSFRVYAETEGLTDLNVNSMLQDKAGFLWVATKNGLFRFDGHRFRRYGVESGMPSSEVWTLLETSNGTLWVVTRGGVAKRVNDGFQKVDIGSNRLPFGMNDLAEDKSGEARAGESPRIYLTTKEGLLWFPGNGARGTVPGTEGQPIWSVAPAFSAGTPAPGVWYARSDGVCHWDTRNNRCYGSAEGIVDGPIGGLVVDREGTVWARSSKHLVTLVRGATKFEARDRGLSYSGLRGYASLGSRGMPLIPTDTGLARWTVKGWSVTGASDGLVVPATSWGLEDREGSLWIGMQGGGIARWLGSGEWENWTQQQGLVNEQVWAMQRDGGGRLLIATSGGIDALDKGKVTHVDTGAIEMAANRFRTQAVDRDNTVWVGTSDAGLARIDAKTRRLNRLGTEGAPLPDFIGSVFVDEHDKIWVVANTGVFAGTRRGSGRVWEKEPVPQADAEVFLNGVEDHEGRIWIATTMGLAVRENGHWSRPGVADGLPARMVDGLAEGPDGSMAISYVDSVNLFQVTSAGGRRSVSGIPSDGTQALNSTSFLGFDHAGNLWRGTGSGVFVRVHGHWIQYTHQDGLVWNGTSMNAFFADPDGSVWIGTAHGLSHHLVSPALDAAEEEDARQMLPPAYVVNVQAGGKSLAPGRVPQIDYRSANLLIGFASPVFRRDKDVRFRYRLVGHDDSWTETDDWDARYADLKPGKYLFEVKAGRWDGRWSEAVAKFPIVITGPWWSAPWFGASSIGLLAALALIAWRLRDRTQVQNARDLKAAVRLRTAELERARGYESSRNRILETLVSDQSLIPVLDGIARLVCEQIPGSDCVILLRQGTRWRVAAAPSVSKSWVENVLDVPGGIPSAALHLASEFVLPEKAPAPGEEPDGVAPSFDSASLACRLLVGPAPCVIRSVPIGLPESPQGAVLLFCPNVFGPEPWQPILENSARMARIAVEHHRFYDDLQFQARHDSLTGLPNRTLFNERLETAVRESDNLGQRLAVLYVDLDGFKEINDRISHRAGDAVLKEVARRMQAVLRERDTAARIGGDEFNILVPDIDGAAEATEVANRLIESISNPLTIEGHPLTVTASIGVSLFPADGTDAAELQRHADAAMYRAKSLGNNRVQSFMPETSGSDAPVEVGTEEELRHALREGWFVLDYQPRFTAEGRVAGFEALLRLNHPVHGLIQPIHFIPVAEDSGLIVPIGAWVLDEVTRQMAAWRAGGLGPVTVAVNVSGRQLVHSDFATCVEECLALHGVPPDWLELELTENAISGGGEAAGLQVQALRGLGVVISIDDFGTGYSSLKYLHRVHVDAIKLGRSFVTNIDKDPASRRLVEALIGIAKGFGLGVIGEGVETDAQKRALIDAGCAVMQGFLFARPRPAAEAERLLRSAGACTGDLQRIGAAVDTEPVPEPVHA